MWRIRLVAGSWHVLSRRALYTPVHSGRRVLVSCKHWGKRGRGRPGDRETKGCETAHGRRGERQHAFTCAHRPRGRPSVAGPVRRCSHRLHSVRRHRRTTLVFPSLFFLNSALFWELQEWKKPKRTGFGFRIQLIGSGRHGTQRLTMNIPVGVLVLLVQVRSLHDIHYSLIGYLPRSGVWQQNRARLSATGPQIRADETHAKFVRWITSPCLCRARVRDSCQALEYIYMHQGRAGYGGR